MWSTDTIWFDVAVVATLYAFGATLFGRFEEHKPRGRRAVKVALWLVALPALAATAGRARMFGVLGVMLVLVAVVHAWWLPKHGVDGWTAEPRERYYERLGVRGAGRPAPRA
jgi:hypothetical protein